MTLSLSRLLTADAAAGCRPAIIEDAAMSIAQAVVRPRDVVEVDGGPQVRRPSIHPVADHNVSERDEIDESGLAEWVRQAC